MAGIKLDYVIMLSAGVVGLGVIVGGIARVVNFLWKLDRRLLQVESKLDDISRTLDLKIRKIAG